MNCALSFGVCFLVGILIITYLNGGRKRLDKTCKQCPFFGHANKSCYLIYMQQLPASETGFCKYEDDDFYKYKKQTLYMRGNRFLPNHCSLNKECE